MKHVITIKFRKIFILGLLLLGSGSVVADTLPPKKSDIYELERSLEQRRKRLDSSLRHTDAMMDSITGHPKYDKNDTLRAIYLVEAKKKRQEAEENRVFWIKTGILSTIVLLAIGFYVHLKLRRDKRRP